MEEQEKNIGTNIPTEYKVKSEDMQKMLVFMKSELIKETNNKNKNK